MLLYPKSEAAHSSFIYKSPKCQSWASQQIVDHSRITHIISIQMAPLRQHGRVPKDRVSSFLNGLRTQSYNDPSVRGSSSQYVFLSRANEKTRDRQSISRNVIIYLLRYTLHVLTRMFLRFDVHWSSFCQKVTLHVFMIRMAEKRKYLTHI